MSMLRKIAKEIYFFKIKKMTKREYLLYHLKKIGMNIGDNCWIFSDKVEGSEPYLVTIGNNVMIAPDVRLVTHDASASYYIPGASDIFGRISIGDNCFIGMGAMILPGVSIANNCIIGAGAVVTKSIAEEKSVVAGNPAKIICTTADLLKKNGKYKLNTWNMSIEEKKEYLLKNEDLFVKR